MAKNWYEEQRPDQRTQEEPYSRSFTNRGERDRNEDRSESYRAGDDDAHRNDRDMAFGSNYQRSSGSRQDSRQDQFSRDEYGYYSRHDMGGPREFNRHGHHRRYEASESGDWRHATDDRDIHREFDTPWDRQFSRDRRFDQPVSSYESSRFNRREQRDYGLGMGRDESRSSYAGRGPKGYRRSDERIREEVSECLERDHYVDASEIEVDVKDGVVTLRGHVEDRRQKRAAEDVIENLSGVKDVRNELVVDQSFFQRAKEALLGGSTESISNTSKGDLVPRKH